ncbi:MAG: glutamate 5-kinase [Nitrospirae bacterium]|nr:glutamate 5-kinase [Nitrospirota bacterium]
MDELCREERARIRKRLRILVLKVGSQILTDPSGALSSGSFGRIARQVALLRKEGVRVVLVSSGAIAAGRGKIGLGKKPLSLALKQAAASAGQIPLMIQWERALGRHGIHSAQILLTPADIIDRERFTNLERTIETLLSLGIVPVVNENDAVATFEIRFGDNDRLSAYVAGLVRAECLLLLSDVSHLYTADPRVVPTAKKISCIHGITPEIERMAGVSRSGLGTGGMASKVSTALWANGWGLPVGVLKGDLASGIFRFFEGKTGTLFETRTALPSNRKIWIGHFSRPRGGFRLDAGAAKALSGGKTSLLGAGVAGVDGQFAARDPVYLLDSQGREIAKGIARTGSADWRAGMPGILVHRNDLVLLDDGFRKVKEEK